MTAPLICLVTGAASGIGLAVTRALLAQGHCVVAADLDGAKLTALAVAERWSTDQCLIRPVDVREEISWQALYETAEDHFGAVDVLYNIAGYLRPGNVVDLQGVDIERTFDVNLKGVVYGTRIAAQAMQRRGHGHIVNLASLAGLAPIHGLSLYSASKFAVRAFSLAAAHELRPYNVAVTTVCPDAVATPMLELQKDYREAAMTFSAPRILSAEELAVLLTGRVLRDRPLELAVPRRRGWLAKLSNLMPGLGQRISPWIERQGLKQQRAWPGPDQP